MTAVHHAHTTTVSHPLEPLTGEEVAAAAVLRARELDRREIRRRFDRRFSSVAMARGYLDLYADRLARSPYAPDLASVRVPTEKQGAVANIA